MNTLMKGNSPLGMIYNQSAENIAYDSNNSVKDKIDDLDTFDLLATINTLYATYNLPQSLSNYKKIILTSYFVNTANDIYVLTTTIVPTQDIISSTNINKVIACFNDGTIRRVQIAIFTNTTQIQCTALDNVTYAKMWGIK